MQFRKNNVAKTTCFASRW